MATNTIRERIIAAIVIRLGAVLTTKGFNLSSGANVTRASNNLDPDLIPCLNVIPQTEEVVQIASGNQHSMIIKIESAAAHGTTNPSVIAEQLLGDMIEAMTAVAWTLSFTSGGTYEPKVGDVVTGATGGATATIEAIAVGSGTWAGGDAAGTFTLRRLDGLFQVENLNVGATLNVATIAGAPSGSKAVALVTGGLAEGVRYIEGGPTEYPDEDDTLTGCSAFFQVNYSTKVGDPYNQP